eukprot:COSAG01_NODE_24791_length_766_cov_1.248876_1_plen_247_part_01
MMTRSRYEQLVGLCGASAEELSTYTGEEMSELLRELGCGVVTRKRLLAEHTLRRRWDFSAGQPPPPPTTTTTTTTTQPPPIGGAHAGGGRDDSSDGSDGSEDEDEDEDEGDDDDEERIPGTPPLHSRDASPRGADHHADPRAGALHQWSRESGLDLGLLRQRLEAVAASSQPPRLHRMTAGHGGGIDYQADAERSLAAVIEQMEDAQAEAQAEEAARREMGEKLVQVGPPPRPAHSTGADADARSAS